MFFSRARTLRVLVSDDDRNWKLVYDNAGRVFGPEPLIVPMNGEQARYVRVQLAEPNYLHLEEVEVLGR
jgi:hypothetical protein